MRVGRYFGGERALERSGRGLSPPSRARRGCFSGLQVGFVCGGFALSLDEVVGAIKRQFPEDRRIAVIGSCGVGFGVNAESLSILAATGATQRELNLLNRVTTEKLSIEEAHAEVARLEQTVEEVSMAAARERTTALEHLNAT